MNPAVLTALITGLKFTRPAIKLLFSQLNLTGTQAFLADIVLKQIDQLLNVATSGGRATFSASAVAGVPLPPEHEWTEAGIERWAEAQSGPDDAA